MRFGTSLRTVVLLGLLTGLFLVVGRLLGGTPGMIIALVFALLLNGGAYWFSDRLTLGMAGARELPWVEAPWLHDLVARLARQASIPKPRLYLIEADQPNAFATGRDPAHAAVAVTTGLLSLLDRDELAGVLAHELAHIKHHDVLFTSIAAVLAGAITAIAEMTQWSFLLGGTDDEEQEGGGLGSLLGSLLMLLLAPLAAVLIQLAVSRGREYEADAGGARLLGNPLPLASALRRLDEASRAVPLAVNPSVAPLFIVNPLAGSWLSGLFATHPPIPERIRRLRAMAPRYAWAA